MKLHRTLGILFNLALFVLLNVSCAAKLTFQKPDPNLLVAYNTENIASNTNIFVVFAADALASKGPLLGQDAGSILSLKPPVEGKAVWENDTTLVFKPAKALEEGKRYTAHLDLAKLGLQNQKITSFDFPLRVSETFLEIALDSPTVREDSSVELQGTIRYSSKLDTVLLEKALEVNIDKKKYNLTWTHTDTASQFKILGITQNIKDQKLSVRLDAKDLGSKTKSLSELVIPGSSSFRYLGARSLGGEVSSVELSFSRPLNKKQDLRGLIRNPGSEELSFDIQDNKVLVHGGSSSLALNLSIAASVTSAAGAQLAADLVVNLPLPVEKPGLRFVGSGAIVPSGTRFIVPIETRNLTAVYIDVLKIYGSNMPQFLQVNDLEGNRELIRVGESVWRMRIPLETRAENVNKWISQGLDLSPLLQKHPDGMFQIRMTFGRDDIFYQCQANHLPFTGLEFPPTVITDSKPDIDTENSYWDYWDEGMNWEEREQFYRYREDPCHPAFYMKEFNSGIEARRNVLASDIGLIARRGLDGANHVYVSNLKTLASLAGVDVSLLNYQGQVLSSAKTDTNGMAILPANEAAYLLIARKGDQSSYLKLNTASMLSVSHFDIDGDRIGGGLKGHLYTERGVWRPGDTVYLGFILQNLGSPLPKGHPVSLEFSNPLGQVVYRETRTEGLNGFYVFNPKTEVNAITGMYQALVRVGGASFTRNIRVETVVPNRLKMNLDFGGANYLSTDTESMTLSAAWLHGAPAPDLKADVSVSFETAPLRFPSYDDYTFEDATRVLAAQRQVLFDGNLGPQSKVSFQPEFSVDEGIPGKLKANVLTRVFEPSGVFSSEQFSIDFHPYPQYVGLKLPAGDASRGMLLTDVKHKAELVLVDRDGKPVNSGSIEVSIAQIEWRWWWEKGSEDLASYADSYRYRKLASGTVAVKNGKADWTFEVKYPSWGRYIVQARDKKTGHSASRIVYIDWPGWAGRASGGEGAGNMLTLQASKPKYDSKELAEISFPSNAQSKALIVVEKSGKIIREEWISTQKDSTSYKLQLNPEMSPNVYVHVSLVQEHGQTKNDVPIRLYGIVPLLVEDAESHLQPRLGNLPAEIKPESTFEFTVSEARGKAMTYTVAVVDEGLLGLTRFKTQDPWQTFNKREASQLKSWDLYKFVAGAFNGKLETLLAIGGGDDGFGNAGKKPDRFEPVVRFIGPVSLAAGQTKTHSLTMPAYVGSVRFMLVAGQNAAFGVTEKEVIVKTDLMIQPSLPRTLAPNEKISIPVTVFNYKQANQEVTVQLEMSGAVKTASVQKKQVKFTSVGDQTVYFDLETGSLPGTLYTKASALAGSVSVNKDTDVEVRSVAVPESRSFGSLGTAIQAGGETVIRAAAYPGLPGTNTATLEISKFPPIDFGSRLAWLIAYPHGCIEQTTSGAFPQVYLEKFADLSPEQLAKTRDNVLAGIDRIKLFQTAGGGFSYWPGEQEASPWGSTYAGHFLLEARKAGYPVTDLVLDAWILSQKNAAASWSPDSSYANDSLVQAYRLYTLALAGQADLASMNRLRESNSLGAVASLRLAAAYWMGGFRDAARELAKKAGTQVPEYQELSYTFGSTLRDKAMMLEVQNLMGETALATSLARDINRSLATESILSTQELAYCLLALMPYETAKNNAPAQLEFMYGARAAQTVLVTKTVQTVDLPLDKETSGELTIKNKSNIPLYARLIVRGIPQAGTEQRKADRMQLEVIYLNADGVLISPDAIRRGEDAMVQLTVRNTSGQALRELVLEHVLASGWELVNDRIGKTDGDTVEYINKSNKAQEDYDFYRWGVPRNKEKLYRYQDIRDDRVLTYFDLGNGETRTFRIRLNKVFDGTYYQPAIRVYAMYDETIQALEPGIWLKPTGSAVTLPTAPNTGKTKAPTLLQ